MGAEIALGSIEDRPEVNELKPLAVGSPFSAATTLRRSGWWMTGSGCSISYLAESAPAQDRRAATDPAIPSP